MGQVPAVPVSLIHLAFSKRRTRNQKTICCSCELGSEHSLDFVRLLDIDTEAAVADTSRQKRCPVQNARALLATRSILYLPFCNDMPSGLIESFKLSLLPYGMTCHL